MERRADWVPHIFLERFGKQRRFQPISTGGSSIDLPKLDPVKQYQKIRDALQVVKAKAHEQMAARDPDLSQDEPGIYLAFKTYTDAFDPTKFMVDGRELTLVKPELQYSERDSSEQVLRYRGVTLVPIDELHKLEHKIEQYGNARTNKGEPRNAALVGVLDDLHLASLDDLWTDAVPPPEDSEMRAWEVWIRGAGVRRFSTLADRLGIAVEGVKLTLPSRQVQWVNATRAQMELVVLNSSTVAELRAGESRLVDREFEPRTRTFAVFAASQVVPSPPDAPAVCVLDTGVVSQHPYLQPGIKPGSELSADPAWPTADVSQSGHGTAVSGIALYGSDLRLIAGSRIALTHCLESVKIIPRGGWDDRVACSANSRRRCPHRNCATYAEEGLLHNLDYLRRRKFRADDVVDGN
jgi:hypothetical protein